MIQLIDKFIWHGLIIFLWMTLRGYYNSLEFVYGLTISVVSLFLIKRYFTGRTLGEIFPLSTIILSFYLSTLFSAIYRSGVEVIKLIVSGQINPKIIVIKTELKSDFKRSILANSITLTPGTITLDISGDELTVLWLNAVTEDEIEATKLISSSFERRLKGD